MTKYFTRTLNTYMATAYTEVWEGDTGKRVPVGSCQYTASSTTDTIARASLKAAGIEVKRGMHVEVENLGGIVYGMTIDEFVQRAHIIDKPSNDLFTRAIYTFEVTLYQDVWEKGVGHREKVGSCQYVAASTSATEARAAHKANGLPYKRGMHVEVAEVGKTLYGMPVDEFTHFAHPVKNAEVQEG